MKSKFLRGALAVAMTTALTPVGALTAFAAEYDAQAFTPDPVYLVGYNNAQSADTAQKLVPATNSAAPFGYSVSESYVQGTNKSVLTYTVTVEGNWTAAWDNTATTYAIDVAIPGTAPKASQLTTLGYTQIGSTVWSSTQPSGMVASPTAITSPAPASMQILNTTQSVNAGIVNLPITPSVFANNVNTVYYGMTIDSNDLSANANYNVQIVVKNTMKFDLVGSVGPKNFAKTQITAAVGTKSFAGMTSATVADGFVGGYATIPAAITAADGMYVAETPNKPETPAGIVTVEYLGGTTPAKTSTIAAALAPTAGVTIDLNGGTVVQSTSDTPVLQPNAPGATVTVQNGTLQGGAADAATASGTGGDAKCAVYAAANNTVNLNATVDGFVGIANKGAVVYNGTTYDDAGAYFQMDGKLVPVAEDVTVLTTNTTSSGTSAVSTSSPYNTDALTVAQSVQEVTTNLKDAATVLAKYYTGEGTTAKAQAAYTSDLAKLTNAQFYDRVDADDLTTIYIATYFDVTFEADCSNTANKAYYSLNIQPMYNVILSSVSGKASILPSDNIYYVDNAGKVFNAASSTPVVATADNRMEINAVQIAGGKLTITDPTTIKTQIPHAFAAAIPTPVTSSNIFVQHQLQNSFEAPAITVAGAAPAQTAQFTTTGFSPFKFTKADPTLTLPYIAITEDQNNPTTPDDPTDDTVVNKIYYNTLQDAVNAVADGDTIVLQSADDSNVTVNENKSFTIKFNSTATPPIIYSGKVTNSAGAVIVPVEGTDTLLYVITGEETTVPDQTTPVWGQAWDNTMQNLVEKSGFAANSCKNIVVATADEYYDALAASGFAGLLNAPIVLTPKSELNSIASSLIQTYAAANATVYIVGGEVAIEPAVETAIQALGVNTQRVYGQNAIGTAEALYAAGNQINGVDWANGAILVSSEGYWDAISAAPYAYKSQTPVLLTTGTGVDETTAGILQGVNNKLALGGYMVVSNETVSTYGLTRVAGEDAYGTSNAFANWCVTTGGMQPNNCSVTTGHDWLDALCAAPFAANNNAPVLLANSVNLTTVGGFISNYASSIENVNIISGPWALGDGNEGLGANVVAAINNALA